MRKEAATVKAVTSNEKQLKYKQVNNSSSVLASSFYKDGQVVSLLVQEKILATV